MAGPTLMPMVMKAQMKDAKMAVVRGWSEKFMGEILLGRDVLAWKIKRDKVIPKIQQEQRLCRR